MYISNRLRTIASKVKEGSKIADIGTDHGWVPIYLVQGRICKNAIASDVNRGPLERAKQNISKFQLENQIQTRLGSGLSTIQPDEVDTVVVAGMGGILMIEILEAGMNVVQHLDTLILQPQLAQDEVRKWLHRHHFCIVDEDLVYEDEKWYEIIVAKKGEEKYEAPLYYEIGKKLFENSHPLLEDFICYKKNKYQLIMQKTENETGERAKEQYLSTKKKLEEYEEEIKKWL